MAYQLIEINLSEEFARKKQGAGLSFKFHPAFGVVVGVLIIGLVGFYLWVGIVIRENEALDKWISDNSNSYAVAEGIKDKQSVMNDCMDELGKATNRIMVHELLHQFAMITPTNVYLTSLVLNNAGELQIDGRAIGGQTIATDYVRKLNGDNLFTNTFRNILLAPRMETVGSEISFMITMNNIKADIKAKVKTATTPGVTK